MTDLQKRLNKVAHKFVRKNIPRYENCLLETYLADQALMTAYKMGVRDERKRNRLMELKY